MLEHPISASSRHPQLPGDAAPEVSIIIPARNEEANIAACLRSLIAQEAVTFEIIVVDDESSDHTAEIARSFAGVKLISATHDLQIATRNRATGKNNAVIQGAAQARASWLLFTDADTSHRPQSLRRSIDEAQAERADLLSYSPEQIVVTFTERAVMPVIFSELAAQYPLRRVCDPASDFAAANGQYILVRRVAYDSVGGHFAVASEILEDVALARRFRSLGFRIHFRYGGDAVRTRMYRNWHQLREGWTKNLALLFPKPTQLSIRTLLLWAAAWLSLALAASGVSANQPLKFGLIIFWILAYKRLRAAHFSRMNTFIALICGPPIFVYLLLRSSHAHHRREISWKGRSYSGTAVSESVAQPRSTKSQISRAAQKELRVEN